MSPPIRVPGIIALGPVLLLMALGSALPTGAGPARAAEQREGGGQGSASGSGEARTERSDQPGQSPKGPADLPFIEINREGGYVDVEGEVCLREGVLELIATIRGGKEHESVFRIDARPRHLHFALLTLGLEPGRPGRWRYEDDKPMPIDPTGDPVRITARYEDEDGERVEHPVGRFVRNRDTGEAMGATRFVFAGSRIEKRAEDAEPSYLADSSGDVVSLVSFNDELLALPTAASNANEKLVWEAHTPRIPPVGKEVVLRIRPAEPAQDAEDAGDAGDNGPSE